MTKNEIQRFAYCLLTRINPSWNIKLRYRAIFKKRLDVEHPVTFTEKLLTLRIKCYNNSHFVEACANKVDVRDFVKRRGFENLLNDVYGIYDSVDEVPWDNLPDSFAMKWNFGATYNIICDNKKSLDINRAKSQMAEWGGYSYHLPFAEMQYSRVKKRIIIEKYLDAKQGFLPYDFKLYCFNGHVECILFIADRDKVKKGGFFSTDWEFLGPPNDTYHEFESVPDKPKSLQTMIACAENLSKGVPFVRIDFFDFNGKAIFGEMTFTPAAGLSTSILKGKEEEWGDLIDMSLIRGIEDLW